MITVCQVVKHSPAEKEHSAICDQIDICLEAIFTECLGEDFKTVLEVEANTLVETYKADPDHKGTFDENTTYTNRSIVYYCGRYYQANTDGTANLVQYPDCSDMWTLLPKFSTPCYETMWNSYMVKYLAYAIYLEAIPLINIRPGSTGFSRQETDGTGSKGLDKAWYSTYCKDIANMTAKRLKALKNYIECNHDETTCDFSTVLFLDKKCGEEICKTDEQQTTRFAWLH